MLLASTAVAQVVPSGYSFQGVAREADGSPSKTKTIVVNVSLYNAGTGGDAEWIQEFTPTTDNYGVFSLVIGSSDQPNKVAGGKANLIDLDWNKKQYFAKVSQKIGGTYYDVNPVRTPLNAVPYAFAAQRVVEKQVLSVKGDTLFLSDGGKVTLPKGFSGKYADLKDSPTNVSNFANDKNYLTTETDPIFTATVLKNVKAADTSRWATDNDKQQLSVSHNNLAIANGNTVKIDADTTNEIQDLVLSGDKLYITKNTSPTQIDLSKYTTDVQTLSVTGNELSISGSNSKVDLSNLQLKAPVITSSVNGLLTGQIQSILVGDSIVVGKNTLFKAELMVGSIIRLGNETDLYEVYSITDNTHLVLTKPHPAAITTFTPFYSTGTMLTVKTPQGDTAFSVTPKGRLQDATGFVMPVGTIIAFGGETVPKGWIKCDGSIIKRADYPELFDAIGTAWGTTGADNFRVPYTRGVFLRGWDASGDNDPDVSSRTNIWNSNVFGNHVGSWQGDAFQGHYHQMAYMYRGGGGKTAGSLTLTGDGSSYAGDGNNLYQAQSPLAGTWGNVRCSTETRPVNVYVNYIIKY